MFMIRKSDDRGKAEFGWLHGRHSFSFGEYYDPDFMGFRTLRVINEDRVEPGQGFGTHPHRDMEIITYVIEGNLEHKDSMGNGSVIRAGDVQVMSAGSGVSHSEFNQSKQSLVHLLQIWIVPNQKGLNPGYQQKSFDFKGQKNRLVLFVSSDGIDQSLKIHQDARVYAAHLEKGKQLEYKNQKRHTWIQMIKGVLSVEGNTLQAGDGLATDKNDLTLYANEPSEFLLFDLN